MTHRNNLATKIGLACHPTKCWQPAERQIVSLERLLQISEKIVRPLPWVCWAWHSVCFCGVFNIIMACTAGCRSEPRTSEAEAAEIPSATVVKVSHGNIAHTLNLAGQFQPYQIIDAHAMVSGYIRPIYVDIGDRVRQGQVLAIPLVIGNAQLRDRNSSMRYRPKVDVVYRSIASACLFDGC